MPYNRSPIGSSLQTFLETFTALKNQKRNRDQQTFENDRLLRQEDRQSGLDAQNTEAHQSNLASASLRQRAGEAELADAPRQRALEQVANIQKLLGGEGAFNSPDFLESAKTAGINIPTKQIALPSRDITAAPNKSLVAGPMSSTPEIADRMGVAPDTGAVLPASVRAESAARAAAEAKAKAIADFLKGAQGGPGMTGDPTPKDRAVADLAGFNPNQIWGAPRKSPDEIAAETKARREAELPFQQALLTMGAGLRASSQPPSLNPNQVANQTRMLRQELSRATTGVREVRHQHQLMEAGMTEARKGNLNAGSQAVLVTFQKILDPTSVVRESEYARSPQGLSIIQKMEGIIPRLTQGGPGVPIQELEKFAQLAKIFAVNAEKAAERASLPILMQADDLGIDRSRIVFNDEPNTPSAPPSNIRGARPGGQ